MKCVGIQIRQDAKAHTKQHACLARELNDGVENWKKMADAFKKLDPKTRRKLIEKSLIEAGVDPKTLTSEVIDGMFVDCRPGENRAKEGGTPRNVMKPDGRFVKGGLTAVFLGLAVLSGADAAAETITGSPACKRMLRRIKDAYAGSGGCESVNCRELEYGKKDAADCATDLLAALNDGGVPDSGTLKIWQSVGDNYDKLVEECWRAKCGSAGGAKK